MKEGWEIVKLEQICDIISGRNQKAVESPNGQYPIYGSGGIMGYASDFLCEAGATIIGRKGSINNPIYVQTRFWNVDTAFGMIPKPNMHSKLFYYFCLYFDFSKMNKGTTIPSLVKKDLYQIDVPYNASLAEQQRIVEILDAEFEKIDALKANAEKNLKNAKDLFQAGLKKELEPKEGWKNSQIVNVVRVINGRAYSKEELLTKGKYRVLRVGNFFTNDNWYYSDLELESDKYCNKGDLLYAWSASFGPKIWDGEKVIYHYHIWKMEPSDCLNKQFLFYWLQSHYLSSQVMSKLHGTTMAHITKGIMEASHIQYPSYEEQVKIADLLNNLNAKCKALHDNYIKTIALCNDMKQALLRKAFNGEL